MKDVPNSERGGAAPIDELAHGLKNMVTAVRMGCMLVQQNAERGDVEAVRQFLDEMRKELDKGGELVERLRELG